jgi:hypothetical protein
MRFEGLQACTKIFLGRHSPTVTLHIGSSTRKTVRNISKSAHDSQKWHDSLNRKWMRLRNVGAARATLTHEDSEWSRKFEEPWQEGWGSFFAKATSKGLPRPFNTTGWRCSKWPNCSPLPIGIFVGKTVTCANYGLMWSHVAILDYLSYLHKFLGYLGRTSRLYTTSLCFLWIFSLT